MSLAHLLADVARLGITLEARGDRLRYRPRSAVTPELVERLTAHKAELLAMLLPTPGMAPASLPTAPAVPVCRCGSTTWRDVPIHGGQSLRRDCAVCGRFIAFPVWQRTNTGHKDQ
jgi:hypothetical protein